MDINTENQEYHKRLRISEIQFSRFQTIDECEQYICHNNQCQIVLIVNDTLPPETIEKFHNLRSVSAIYIRQTHEPNNAQNLRKIWRIPDSTDVNQLMNKIQQHEQRRVHWLEPTGISNFQENDDDNTSIEINGEFLHSQLLLDSLLTMNLSDRERSTAIAYFRKEYATNTSVLEKINEFESTYTANQALFWYTQSSFFYSILNRSFRIQNIDALYQMRIFIRDIRDQLIEQQRNGSYVSIQVYRGQLISKAELERFEVDELVSMNSFFSTTFEQTYATFLLPEQDLEGDLTSVLFEITINEYSSSTKPFANISEKSAFPDEQEVLFMAGSIFRITKINLNTNGINVINLLLCGDDSHNLKNLFEYMRIDIPPNTIPLTYGIVLANAGKAEQAEKFFRNILNELPNDDPMIADVLHQLGNVLDDRGEFDESLEFYEKSLSNKLKILSEDTPSIANTYVCCGVAYLRKSEFDRAREFYQKAMDIYKKVYDDDCQDVAMCLFNIADIDRFEKKYDDSLRNNQRALEIWTKCLPENHPDIARAHMGIAHIHNILMSGTESLEHYKQALAIMQDALPPTHPDLVSLYDGIGKLYYSTDENQIALEYFELSLEIKKQLYAPDHQTMADSYHSIGLVYKDLGDYQQAVSYLQEAYTIQSKYFSSDDEVSIVLFNDLEEAKAAQNRA